MIGIFIKDKPSNVAEGEEYGDDGICDPFLHQSVRDQAIPGSLFSVNSSLCLNEEPSDKQAHHDSLNQETEAKNVVK